MIVYLDLVLMIDFSITFLFLLIMNKILHKKINIFRIMIASITSSLLVLSYLLEYNIYLIIKALGGTLIVLISTKIKNIKSFIIEVVMYYLLNFAFIGLLSSFKINQFILMLISLFVIITFSVIESRKKDIINLNVNTYDLMIYLKSKCLNIKGFMDSGNESEFKGRPIIYLALNYLNTDFEFIGNSIVSTVNGVGLQEVYQAKQVYLNGVQIDCYFAFIDLGDKECLLNVLLI